MVVHEERPAEDDAQDSHDLRHRDALHFRAVHPDRLDGEPAYGVHDHVDVEDIALPQAYALLASQPQEQTEVQEVPDHLIREGGVEAHVGAKLTARDLALALHAYGDAPGEGGGFAECLLVEVVA